MNKYKFSIVIPCFNEEKTVFNVVNKICIQFHDFLIVVVDDGSTDNSLSELQKIKFDNFKLLKLDSNRGKGFAMREGMKYIKNKSEIVIFTDADEEILINDISRLSKVYKKTDYNAIFGSRFLEMSFKNKIKMGIHRYYANVFLTKLTNFYLNQNLTDMETALKSFKTKFIDNLNLKSDNFDIEPEIVKSLSQLNIDIFEIGIGYEPRSVKEGKKISFKDGFKTLKYILKF